MNCTHVFALPGENHIIDEVVAGRGTYSGETLDQIQIRYPGAVCIHWDDWLLAARSRQQTPITWALTTRDRYTNRLEVLPPAMWQDGAFLVGEPMDHDIATGQPRFEAYWRRHDHYFVASRPLTHAELRQELAATSAEMALIAAAAEAVETIDANELEAYADAQHRKGV